MADETKTATVVPPTNELAPQPKPFILDEKGRPLDFVPADHHLDLVEPIHATARIRAFEDEHLGPDAVRINDKIERGSGSPFAALSDEHKRQYAALEKLVAAEQKLADAHAALIQAETDHEAALAAAEPAPDAE